VPGICEQSIQAHTLPFTVDTPHQTASDQKPDETVYAGIVEDKVSKAVDQ
jgi:hypothetical protein